MDKLNFFKKYVLSNENLTKTYAQGSFENGKPVLIFFDGKKHDKLYQEGKDIKEGMIYTTSYLCSDRTVILPKEYDYEKHAYHLSFEEIFSIAEDYLEEKNIVGY